MKFKTLLKKSSKLSTIKHRGITCLNCGQPLQLRDKFCSNCSQKNSTKKITLHVFFEEFLSSVFSYDSRLRKTLTALIFKPGKITKDYIQGKRKTYANPFRFYLSISILFFIIWGTINKFDDIDFNDENNFFNFTNNANVSTNNKDKTTKPIKSKKDSIVISETGKNTQIDSIEKQPIKKATLTKTYKDYYYSENSLNQLNTIHSFSNRFLLYRKFHKETEIKRSKTALDSLKHVKTRYHSWLYKKASSTNDLDQLGELLSYFIKQLPIIIFFFLPIFAIFVWFFYIRRKHTYTDHLIFLFHTQTMFFVLYGIGILLNEIFKTDIFIGFINLVFLFYLYRAMRTFYNQGRLKTITKLIILNTIFFILATIGAIFAFAVSFATY